MAVSPRVRPRIGAVQFPLNVHFMYTARVDRHRCECARTSRLLLGFVIIKFYILQNHDLRSSCDLSDLLVPYGKTSASADSGNRCWRRSDRLNPENMRTPAQLINACVCSVLGTV